MSETLLPSSPVSAPPLELGAFLTAIGDFTRWAMLAALSEGEPLMITEIAQRLGRTPSSISKHMAVLRRAGLVRVGRGNLYEIPVAYRRERGVADFGPARLRFSGAG